MSTPVPVSVNRTPTDDPIYGEGMGLVRVENRRQVLIPAECKGYPYLKFSLPTLQDNQTPDRNLYKKR